MHGVRVGRLRPVIAVVAAASLLAACGGSGGESGDGDEDITLTIVSYGGPYQEAQAEAFFKPFMEENPNIKIVEDSPTDTAKLTAMVDSGNTQWDVALVANDFGNESQAQWLTPIDYSIVDKDKFVEGYAGEYRVGADVEGTVVAFRSDKVDSPPKSWADIFDTTKYPGKRALYKYAAGGVLEGALLADGVAPEDLYPLDVDRALKKLDTIKDDIVWWETSAQSQQLLESGEVTMGMVWIGRAVDASKAAPVEIMWDSWLSTDGIWVVPKGTKNEEAAMEFLEFATSTEPQIKFAELTDYGPVNAEAAQDPAVAENKNRPSNHLDTQVRMDDNWLSENLQDLTKQFNGWVLE